MTLREALQYAEEQLRAGSHPVRARLDAEALLLHLTGKNRAWLLTHAADPFGGCTATQYAALLQRRLTGEPIQYITGTCEFYGLPFHVTRDVLIPRPETEHLVEKALELARNMGAPGLDSETWESTQPPGAPSMESAAGGRHGWETTSSSTSKRAPSLARTLGQGWETNTLGSWSGSILDIGTGSGAIAIALAHHLPHARVTATDVSPAALSIARENAERNHVAERIRFLPGDLLAPVASDHFDLIVSNPPYVAEADLPTLDPEVRDFEPHAALFAGPDGLAVYSRLIPAAFAALVPGGWLLLEIGYGQSESVPALCAAAGFHRITTTPDLQGIPRVVAAAHP
ncbi:MAG: peptide chain release factor N(5)-glutamine methyltransferase [Acidobacteriota bacterium]|nr:peptide chain release factor N(5)-glutamine methyltransferase [Acidobacteriota bacterium]